MKCKKNKITLKVLQKIVYLLSLGIFTVVTIYNLEEISGNLEIDYEDIAIQKVWQDIEYFPIPYSKEEKTPFVTYVDTWGAQRTYGGERVHEGCDLMATIDESGLYPILSITDGMVTKKGWLEKGGYRLGITSDSGTYFYYAHLDSYVDIEVGDMVKAGQLIAYMGDSGYGEEGTTGMFANHLHLGIYVYLDGVETAINPYPFLLELENNILESDY